MWISGEVIVAQKLLTQMGAASVDSIVLGRRDDLAVGRALRKYARYAIERIEISCPASSQKQSPPICLLWFCYEWPDKANASWRPPRRTAISRTGLVADCGGGLRVLPAPDEGGPASRSAFLQGCDARRPGKRCLPILPRWVSWKPAANFRP
jgi:hypothetical protein